MAPGQARRRTVCVPGVAYVTSRALNRAASPGAGHEVAEVPGESLVGLAVGLPDDPLEQAARKPATPNATPALQKRPLMTRSLSVMFSLRIPSWFTELLRRSATGRGAGHGTCAHGSCPAGLVLPDDLSRGDAPPRAAVRGVALHEQ